MSEPRETYYQLVLIWIRDAAMFGEYLSQLPPIVAKYGGAADRIFQPLGVSGDALTLPHAVNFVHYDDKESYRHFGEDPEFRQIEPLRSGSIDMLAFEGWLTRANPTSDGFDDRIYAIDLEFSDKTSQPSHEDTGRGVEVEYVLRVDTGSAVSGRTPHQVRIAYSAGTNGDATPETSTGSTIRITAKPQTLAP
ncbi:hypothetical protein [Actinopolymorpha sp. B9G3]|uniref:hypothetical protein n=1 Tax=Actinopolymorpha sp. B9G3 TaxID=3158970 RepID=UPI0032D8CC76